MKKNIFIAAVAITTAGMMSCGTSGGNNPGRAYAPDMVYSVAIDAYAALDTAKFTNNRDVWGNSEDHKIFYNARPVKGTIARGDMQSFPYDNSDTANYTRSGSVKNPLDIASIDFKEAERLYLVNCGICHGTKLDGNGPLYANDGPYKAAPKNLLADDMKALRDGSMFYSISYGKGQMGGYASQLNTKQRWEVVAYIRAKQNGGAPATAAASAE